MIARRTEIKFTFRLTFWISNFSHSAPRHDPRRVNFIRVGGRDFIVAKSFIASAKQSRIGSKIVSKTSLLLPLSFVQILNT